MFSTIAVHFKRVLHLLILINFSLTNSKQQNLNKTCFIHTENNYFFFWDFVNLDWLLIWLQKAEWLLRLQRSNGIQLTQYMHWLGTHLRQKFWIHHRCLFYFLHQSTSLSSCWYKTDDINFISCHNISKVTKHFLIDV